MMPQYRGTTVLDQRLRALAKEQLEILNLKKILLSVGGKHLVGPPAVTHDARRLIEGGVMDYRVTERIMEPNMCHLNSATVFPNGKAIGVGTGSALTDGCGESTPGG